MSRKRICVSIFRRFNSFNYISLTDGGSQVDVDSDSLVKFFEEEMHLSEQDIRPKRVISRADIDDKLQSLNDDSERYDFFIFVLLAKLSENGADGLVFNDPKDPISLDYIFDKINQSAFVMKPKLFFIQADNDKLVPVKQDFKGGEKVQIEVKKIPTDADRLVIMSTIPQELAQPSIIDDIMQYYESQDVAAPSRKPYEEIVPSFLIQTIMDVLKENKADGNDGTDLFCLTPNINWTMRQKINALQKKRKEVMTRNDTFKNKTKILEELEVPLVSSTLTKEVFLF